MLGRRPRRGRGVQKKFAPAEDPPTAREREVLQLVAEGRSTKEVASILDISVKTMETHRTRMQKRELHETSSRTRYAIRRGIIQP